MAEEWHYSRGGQQLGPISREELRRMASAGELLPTDQIWKEGMPKWAPANKLKQLSFPTAVKKTTLGPPPLEKPTEKPTTQTEILKANDTCWESTMAEEWHYSRSGQQFGPVSGEELRRMASAGELQPTDQIWKVGMPKWAPANKLKQLSFPTAVIKATLGPPPLEKPTLPGILTQVRDSLNLKNLTEGKWATASKLKGLAFSTAVKNAMPGTAPREQPTVKPTTRTETFNADGSLAANQVAEGLENQKAAPSPAILTQLRESLKKADWVKIGKLTFAVVTLIFVGFMALISTILSGRMPCSVCGSAIDVRRQICTGCGRRR